MIIDTFLYFNEEEILLSRLEYLYNKIDFFVICESNYTFSGKPKPLYFANNRIKFSKYSDKIIYHCIDCLGFDIKSFTFDNFLDDYFTQVSQSYAHKSSGRPLSCLSKSFQREVFQRDSIIIPLLNNGFIDDDNYILVNDVDEIPALQSIDLALELSSKNQDIITFEQQWFKYYANQLFEPNWYGSRLIPSHLLKGSSIDLMRFHLENSLAQPGPVIRDAGWHCSHMGGHNKVLAKLDAYDYQGRRGKIFFKIRDKLFKSFVINQIKSGKSPYLTDKSSLIMNTQSVLEESQFHKILYKHAPNYFQ